MTSEDTFYYSKLSQLGVEEWLSIPGYEGYYEASNLGRVKSVERVIHRSDGRTTPVQEAILTPQLNNQTGYQQVILRRNGERSGCRIHSLVALVFIGSKPVDKEVAHNNGNSIDNSLCNIRYATRKENAEDRIRHGTSARGSQATNVKLDELNVRAIKRFLSEGNTPQSVIAKRYGVSQSTISYIRSGRNWGWLE